MEKSTQNFDEIEKKLKQVEEILKNLKKDFKKFEEDHKKLSKDLKEDHKKLCKCKCKCKYEESKSIKKMPSGFAKPTRITDELCEFLQIEKGSKLPRTEVGEKIREYIRKNNLQDKNNGSRINPDVKLTKLLDINTSQEELTYFNIQRYMRKHFV